MTTERPECSDDLPATDPGVEGSASKLRNSLRQTRAKFDLPPQLPAGYTHVRKLGAGGQASVHLATDPVGEYVAVKVVSADDPRAADEGSRLAALRHDHLARFREWIPSDSGGLYCYLVMDYVEGQPLNERELEPAERQRVFTQLADVLQYLHTNDVVHRDVKPENILVCGKRDGVKAILVDLGVAKGLTGPAGRTGTEEFVGTRRYCPPEHLRRAKAVTPAADVYALGVCLYECLAKKHPFLGASDAVDDRSELATLIEMRRPRPISCPDHPAEVDRLARTMLKINRRRRPTSADLPDLMKRASAGLPLPRGIRPDTWLSYPARWVGKNRFRLGGLAATCALLATVAWGVASHLGKLDEQRAAHEADEKRLAAEDAGQRSEDARLQSAADALARDVMGMGTALAIVERERYSPASLKLQGEYLDNLLSRFAAQGAELPTALRLPVGRFHYERAERRFNPTDSNLGDQAGAGADIDACVRLFEPPAGKDIASREAGLDLAKALTFRARLPARPPDARRVDFDRATTLLETWADPALPGDCLRRAGTLSGSADFALGRGDLPAALVLTEKALDWAELARAAGLLPPSSADLEREVSLRRKAIIHAMRGEYQASLEVIEGVTNARRARDKASPRTQRHVRDLLGAIEVEIGARVGLKEYPVVAELAREALGLVTVLKELEPDNSEPDAMRLGFVLQQATALERQRQFGRAVEVIDETQALRRGVREASPILLRFRCAQILEARGRYLHALDRTDDALTTFGEAEAAIKALMTPTGEEPDQTLRALYGRVLFWRGQLLARKGRLPDAAELLDQATAIQARIREQDRRNLNAHTDLLDTRMAASEVRSKAAAEPSFPASRMRQATQDLRERLVEAKALFNDLPPAERAKRTAQGQQIQNGILRCDNLLRYLEGRPD